jgi:hypothetical protein
LTIVIFASVHALQRMPFVDRRGHEDSYRRLFQALTDLAPQARILFKPKWESTEWLRGVVGPSAAFEETTRTPLGSGLIDQSQKTTAAAMQIAEK